MPLDSNKMPPGRNTQEFSSAAGIIKYVLARERDRYRYLDNPIIGSRQEQHKSQPSFIPPVLSQPLPGSTRESKGPSLNVVDVVKKIFGDLF